MHTFAKKPKKSKQIDVFATHSRIECDRWRNIKVDIFRTTLLTLLTTMALGNLTDTYVFLVYGNKNSWVGYLSGVRGITTFVVSFPIGMLVDKWERTYFCKVASVICLLFTITGLYAFWYNSTVSLFLYNILFRLGTELSNSATGAIFTDSLYKTERVKYFTLRGTILSLSLGIGPLISLAYFTFYNNSWELEVLRKLIMISLVVIGPLLSISLLLYTSVDLEQIPNRTLTSQSTYYDSTYSHYSTMKDNPSDRNSNGSSFELSTINQNHIRSETLFTNSNSNNKSSVLNYLTTSNFALPIIILLCSSIRMFGAGMMVTYLPLFFKNDYQLKPNQVSTLYLAQAIFISAFNHISNKLIGHLGRPATNFTYGLVAAFFLACMSTAKNLKVIILAFLLRGGIQNAIRPIDQTMIMDYTSSKSRGKWIAATGFVQIVFSGSTIIGGYIADENDYRFIFKIATFFHVLACFLYLVTFILVEDNELPKTLQRKRQAAHPTKFY